MSSTFYEILGVSKNASTEDIKKAYRSLAKKFHPDINKKADPEIFRSITKAYEILLDENSRRKYDESITVRTLTKIQNPSDRDISIIISVNKSIFGGDIKVPFKFRTRCTHCKSTGIECYSCHGTGSIIDYFGNQHTCKICEGYGFVNKYKCNYCHGSGKMTSEEYKLFSIPPGILDNTKLKIVDNNLNYYVTVKIKKSLSDKYDRAGNDLIVTIPIDPIAALIGGKVLVPLLSGVKEFSFPENLKYRNNYVIEGQGVPNTNGKLIVSLVIDYDLANKDRIKYIRECLSKLS